MGQNLVIDSLLSIVLSTIMHEQPLIDLPVWQFQRRI